MEVAAGVQLRLHSAAAHALWPDAKRQPRLARRERHRQKARRRLFGEFSHHRSARRDREDHVHYPLGAPACAAAGEKGPHALFQCHPAHGARGRSMFLFYYVLSKDAGSGLVYLFVFCVHGVCRAALRCGGSSSALAARWADSLLRGISISCAATGTTASRSFSTTATSPRARAGSRRAECSLSARAS